MTQPLSKAQRAAWSDRLEHLEKRIAARQVDFHVDDLGGDTDLQGALSEIEALQQKLAENRASGISTAKLASAARRAERALNDALFPGFAEALADCDDDDQEPEWR